MYKVKHLLFQVYSSEVRARGVGGMAKDTEALAFAFGSSFTGKPKGKPPRALATKAKPKTKAAIKKATKPTAKKAKGAAKKGKKATEKGKKKGIPKTSVKKSKGKIKKRKPKKTSAKGKVHTFLFYIDHIINAHTCMSTVVFVVFTYCVST